MPNTPEEGADMMARFLDEVVAFESMFVTRRTAMKIVAEIDRDYDLILDAAHIEPVGPVVYHEDVTSLEEAFDQILRTRGTDRPYVVTRDNLAL